MAYKKTADEVTRMLGPQGAQAIRQHLGAIWQDLPFLSEEQFTKTLEAFEKHFSPIVERVVPEDRWFEAYKDHALQNSSNEIPPPQQAVPDAPPIETAKPQPQKLSPEQQAQLADIDQPSGSKYQLFLKGDPTVLAERDALYQTLYPGKVEIT